jgi:hypothetical protein
MNVCGKDIKIQGRLIRTASLAAERYEFLEDADRAIASLRECGTRIDIFTFMQSLPNTTPQYDFAMEWDNLAALPVSTFEQWWAKQIDGKTRNMVRRAEKKGLTVREVPFDEALARGIWEIYNECPVRQGRRFAHYGKDLDAVRTMSATFLETSVFIGAYLGEELIGFAKLTADQAQSQAAIMHIISKVAHRDKAATNALIAQSVHACANRGIPYLVYSQFAYGNKQRDTLSDFKESNGFGRVNLPRYYVPLTSVGSLALRLGLHRRLVDRVPESMLMKYRDLRHSWYSRKPQAHPQAS